RLGEPLAVALGQILPLLVQHGQAHHVPPRGHRAYPLHLDHPAGGDPRPGTERIEPEIHVHGCLLGHLSSPCVLVTASPATDNLPDLPGIPAAWHEIMPAER